MTAHRVAYASVVDGALAIGHPAGAHVLLDTEGIRALQSRTDEANVEPATAQPVQAVWSVQWAALRELRADATWSRMRHPGGLTRTITALVTAAGLDWDPATAPVTVHVTDAATTHVFECTGYVGRGYFRAHARALAVLLQLLVDEPDQRTHLADPVALLARVVAASGTADESAIRGRLKGQTN